MDTTVASLASELGLCLSEKIALAGLYPKYNVFWQGAYYPESKDDDWDGATIRIICSGTLLWSLLIGKISLVEAVANKELTFTGPPESIFQLRQMFSVPLSELPATQSEDEVAEETSNIDDFCTGISAMLSHLNKSPEEMQLEINHRLYDVTEKLYHRSSLYRELLPSLPSSETEISVSNLPVLDKPTLRRITEELGLSEVAGLIPLSTSGSTGKKFKFYRTELDYWMGFYRYLLVMEAFSLTGIPATYFPNPGLKVCEMFQRSGLIQMQKASLPAADHIHNLRQHSSEVLYSFPLFLNRIVEELERRQQSIETVKRIVTVGDFLDKRTRKRCNSVFPNASITTTYGSTETGLMAYECPETGHYHVLEPDFSVAVLRDGRVYDEGPGKLLISKLSQGGTPFLNYDVGDEVVLYRTPCSCGDSRVHFKYRGRSKYDITTASNTAFNTLEMDDRMSEVKGVKCFEAVCTKDDDVVEGREDSISDVLTVYFEVLEDYKEKEQRLKIEESVRTVLSSTGFQVVPVYCQALSPVEGNKRPIFTVK